MDQWCVTRGPPAVTLRTAGEVQQLVVTNNLSIIESTSPAALLLFSLYIAFNDVVTAERACQCFLRHYQPAIYIESF
jgi:hypothetical protein